MEAIATNDLVRDIKKFDKYAMCCDNSFVAVIVGDENGHEIVHYDTVKDQLTNENPENGGIKYFGFSGMSWRWAENMDVLVRKFHENIEWYNREDVINTYQIPWKEMNTKKYYVWFDGVAYRGIQFWELKLEREGGQIAYYLRDKVEALKVINHAMMQTVSNITYDIQFEIKEAERLEKEAEKLRAEKTPSGRCSCCGGITHNRSMDFTNTQKAYGLEKKAKEHRQNADILKKFKSEHIDM